MLWWCCWASGPGCLAVAAEPPLSTPQPLVNASGVAFCPLCTMAAAGAPRDAGSPAGLLTGGAVSVPAKKKKRKVGEKKKEKGVKSAPETFSKLKSVGQRGCWKEGSGPGGHQRPPCCGTGLVL